MKNKNIFFLVLIAFIFLLLPIQVRAVNVKESLLIKITVVENGVEHEWEYTSPGKYEYELGEKVIKGEQAKQSMAEILGMIELSEHSKITDMVAALRKNKFKKIERLDIRWMTGENKLYTWIWAATENNE
ncbi:MAG: hypothetical protein LRY71_15730 [Bacillaceae bacterium]|nr:hypothetical protein [Bacillaceae bacterium]